MSIETPTDIPTATPIQMRAITHHRYGTADVLRAAHLPRPVFGDNQVLVRVRAAGLDRGTEHLLTGKPYAVRLAMGLRARISWSFPRGRVGRRAGSTLGCVAAVYHDSNLHKPAGARSVTFR